MVLNTFKHYASFSVRNAILALFNLNKYLLILIFIFKSNDLFIFTLIYFNNLMNNYNALKAYINVLLYILVNIYLLLFRTSDQIFSSRNI